MVTPLYVNDLKLAEYDLLEWLDISDRFVKCECPFPRTSVDPDDEGLSRERPHGMDKSELHQPGYFTTAQTR
ncbi:unnamed protein product, partial [Allacma fusca]